jgi:hypothetical protein
MSLHAEHEGHPLILKFPTFSTTKDTLIYKKRYFVDIKMAK